MHKLTRATGFVEKQWKLDAAALLWALTLDFAVGEDHSLEALRQSHLQSVGDELKQG